MSFGYMWIRADVFRFSLSVKVLLSGMSISFPTTMIWMRSSGPRDTYQEKSHLVPNEVVDSRISMKKLLRLVPRFSSPNERKKQLINLSHQKCPC